MENMLDICISSPVSTLELWSSRIHPRFFLLGFFLTTERITRDIYLPYAQTVDDLYRRVNNKQPR